MEFQIEHLSFLIFTFGKTENIGCIQWYNVTMCIHTDISTHERMYTRPGITQEAISSIALFLAFVPLKMLPKHSDILMEVPSTMVKYHYVLTYIMRIMKYI